MVEVSEGEIQTTVMDHHGLVAAICQDLKIAERIDNRLPSGPQIFASKPIERLLGVGLKAKDITDYALGCAFDNIRLLA